MMEKSINITTDGKGYSGIIRLIVIGGVGIIGIALAIKMIKKSAKMGAGKEILTNDNVRLAMELNSAINPSRSWIGGLFAGPDNDELFRLGHQITNYEQVAAEYQKLYDESLSHELQDALGPDYPEFIQNLKGTQTGSNLMSDEAAKVFAEKLYKEMDGWNVGRDVQLYTDLYRLSDSNFNKVIAIYNTQGYDKDFKTKLMGESGYAVLVPTHKTIEFESIKEKILLRIG